MKSQRLNLGKILQDANFELEKVETTSLENYYSIEASNKIRDYIKYALLAAEIIKDVLDVYQLYSQEDLSDLVFCMDPDTTDLLHKPSYGLEYENGKWYVKEDAHFLVKLKILRHLVSLSCSNYEDSAEKKEEVVIPAIYKAGLLVSNLVFSSIQKFKQTNSSQIFAEEKNYVDRIYDGVGTAVDIFTTLVLLLEQKDLNAIQIKEIFLRSKQLIFQLALLEQHQLLYLIQHHLNSEIDLEKLFLYENERLILNSDVLAELHGKAQSPHIGCPAAESFKSTQNYFQTNCIGNEPAEFPRGNPIASLMNMFIEVYASFRQQEQES